MVQIYAFSSFHWEMLLPKTINYPNKHGGTLIFTYIWIH